MDRSRTDKVENMKSLYRNILREIAALGGGFITTGENLTLEQSFSNSIILPI